MNSQAGNQESRHWLLSKAGEHVDAALLLIAGSFTRSSIPTLGGLWLAYLSLRALSLRNPEFTYRSRDEGVLFAVSLCPLLLGAYDELALLPGISPALSSALVSLGSVQALLDFAFAAGLVGHCLELAVFSAIGVYLGLPMTSALTFLFVQKLLAVIMFAHSKSCFSAPEGIFWAQLLAMFCTAVQADHAEGFFGRSPCYVFSCMLICFEVLFVVLTALLFSRPPPMLRGCEWAPLWASILCFLLFFAWLVTGVGGWVSLPQLLAQYPTPGVWFLVVLTTWDHQRLMLQWVLLLFIGIGVIHWAALRSLALNGLNRAGGQDAASFEQELEHLVRAQQASHQGSDADAQAWDPPSPSRHDSREPSSPSSDEAVSTRRTAAKEGMAALDQILESERERRAAADNRTAEEKAETDRARVLFRKAFHIMVVALFGPPLLSKQAEFLGFSMLVATLTMVTVEVCRICRCPWIAWRMDAFMGRFMEGTGCKMVGQVPNVHHVYVLVGCALPVWIEVLAGSGSGPSSPSSPFGVVSPARVPSVAAGGAANLAPLRQAAGVLLVGVGDACAAICGVTIGQMKWPCSQKTVESALAFVVSVSLTTLVLTPFVDATDSRQLNVFRVALLLTAFLDAYTQDMESLVLPLYFCPTLKALCDASM